VRARAARTIYSGTAEPPDGGVAVVLWLMFLTSRPHPLFVPTVGLDVHCRWMAWCLLH